MMVLPYVTSKCHIFWCQSGHSSHGLFESQNFYILEFLHSTFFTSPKKLIFPVKKWLGWLWQVKITCQSQ